MGRKKEAPMTDPVTDPGTGTGGADGGRFEMGNPCLNGSKWRLCRCFHGKIPHKLDIL